MAQNLAVQDAVAAANLLAASLRRGTPSEADLAGVQRRRERPTRATQRLQVLIQDRIIVKALRGGADFRAPFLLRMMTRVPLLRDLPGRIVGMGLRPERPDPELFR